MSILKNFSFSNRRAIAGATMMQGSTPAPFGLGALRHWLEQRAAMLRRRPLANGTLEHLATLPLNPSASLVLVRLGGETLLLGATPQRVSLLAKQPAGATLGLDREMTLSQEAAQP